MSKTWRVHTIFTNVNASKRVTKQQQQKSYNSVSFFFFKKKAIKDYRLFIFVGILFVIDTVLLTTWQIVDPLQIFKDTSKTRVGSLKSKKNEKKITNFLDER